MGYETRLAVEMGYETRIAVVDARPPRVNPVDGIMETITVTPRLIDQKLFGKFPTGKQAIVSSVHRIRKEQIEHKAFQWTVDQVEQNKRWVDLLFGHDYKKPLASTRRDAKAKLKLHSTADGLEFEVDGLPDTDYARDVLGMIDAGVVGISPGFEFVPESVKPGTVEFVEEAGTGVLIRKIHDLVLHELSIVTRPAYHESSVELRSAATPLLPLERRMLLCHI